MKRRPSILELMGMWALGFSATLLFLWLLAWAADRELALREAEDARHRAVPLSSSSEPRPNHWESSPPHRVPRDVWMLLPDTTTTEWE